MNDPNIHLAIYKYINKNMIHLCYYLMHKEKLFLFSVVKMKLITVIKI